ncbi:hypothetical protein LXA43DRAFT_192599 [Ganoderma leucocontextum]|nr:hypothetical protein LXA43DRAFT_192599 [Ganoderma leucocontextum]
MHLEAGNEAVASRRPDGLRAAQRNVRYLARTASPSQRKRCTTIRKHAHNERPTFLVIRAGFKIDATRRFHCLSLHPATTRVVPSASCWGSTGHRPSHSNRSQTSLGRRPVRPGTARASSKQGEYENHASLAPPVSRRVLTFISCAYAPPRIKRSRFCDAPPGFKNRSKDAISLHSNSACTARAISPADYFTRPGGLVRRCVRVLWSVY